MRRAHGRRRVPRESVAMPVKGDLKLEIDEQGVEVRITITPDEGGADVTPESILLLLAEKKVRTGIDTAAVDKALRSLARKGSEPVSFVAAAGTPPRPAQPESVVFEALPIPPRLSAVARTVLAAAPGPRGFRLREERAKLERKVFKKPALPFFRPKEETEVVIEKKTVREEVAIDPAVAETGFVARGCLVARVRPGKEGKEGRSVFGRFVPAPRPGQHGFLFCDGLSRTGADVTADISGFLRKGATWCDVVPFRDHTVEVAASPDGLTCLLSVTPGDPAAPRPEATEILERAQTLGFTPQSLLAAAEVRALVLEAVAGNTPLTRVSITPIVNGAALVTVSADKLTAVLSLRKGRGGGTPLTHAHAADAIRTSRVRGFNPEAVKTDLLAFFKGPAAELADYLLVTGRPPKTGAEPKLEWRALFLPAAEAEKIRGDAAANAGRLAGIASLSELPLEKVEAVARVKLGADVLRVVPATGGAPGVDVFGAAIPVSKDKTPGIRLFEGCALRGGIVVATAAGILEKGSDGPTVLLRVRLHKDAELHVSISADRMKAALSFSPPEGDGTRISVQEVRARVAQAGVVRGIMEERMLAALDCVSRGQPLTEHGIAEGRPPRPEATKRVVFHAKLASGKAVALRADGRADFRAQDRISRVSAGELIATMRPRNSATDDGWDVCGAPVTLSAKAEESLQAGRGVREDVEADGMVRFTAETAGELIHDGGLLSVLAVHSVDGSVDMSTGNVNFPGNVHVGGSVRSGFVVVAGGILEVGESVEAALLSAGGSITVGQGIKGEGKAILRSRKNIAGVFAEQAVLLAVGDVHLRGPCVRCQVRCNGKLLLDSEKGSLVGGEVRASEGAVLQNIGSPGGTRTVVSFGQDFLVRDQIEREEREVAALAKKVADLDTAMAGLQKHAEAAALARGRAEKLAAMKLMEQRKLRLIALHDKFDEHIPSEIFVRGTIFPGAVLESHGRRFEVRTEKKMITLHFDPEQGKIVEKL